MVTWTAIPLGILQHPRQCHAGKGPGQAQKVVAEDVGECEQPLALVEKRHGLERIAGEGGEGSAETDHDQQAPAWIDQHSLRSPNDEEADTQTTGDVDDQRSVREYRPQNLRGVTAYEVTAIGANDCAQGYDKDIQHGVLPKNLVGVISLEGRRLWRTPSP